MGDHNPHRNAPAKNLALSEPRAWVVTIPEALRLTMKYLRTWLLYCAAAGSAVYAVKQGVPLWLTPPIALSVCAVLVLVGFGIQRTRKRRGQGFDPFS